MSHDGVLRPATIEDIDELVAMWAQYMHVHALNPAYRELRRDALLTRRRAFRERIEEATSVVFVIEGEDEGLDGMIVCFVEENEPYFRPSRYIRIQTPFVRPEARRRGYLKRLLEAAYEWAGEWEFQEVRLYTGADNIIANAVADDLGFEAVEVIRRRPLEPRPSGPWED